MRGISAIIALLQVITPGLTHDTIFNAAALAATVIPFLDAQ
jgi:hypothetical protein